MNKKKKYFRIIAVAVVILAFAAAAFYRLNIEPSDYGKSLKKQLKTAQSVLKEAKTGNKEGEYSAYTVLAFKNQIKEAKKISEDKDSYYEIEKKAYESLKKETKEFEKNKNANVLSADEVEKIIKDSKTVEKTKEFSKWSSLVWSIEPGNLTKTEDINLDVTLKGPYFEDINSYMEKYAMQGKVLAFYHNGNFPGKMGISMDYVLESGTVYVYKYNQEAKSFDYVSSPEVSDSKVNFEIESGGTYIILSKSVEEYTASQGDGESVSENQTESAASETTAGEQESTAGNKSTKGSNSSTSADNSTSNPANAGSPSQPGSSGNTITVTIEIHCDTLSSDLSKLTDQSVKSYIPASGTILPKTTLQLAKGKTVEYALKLATRNAGIQMECSYSAAYSSTYIEGINYLYQFDAGDDSGWMYKVNGQFPNYGCSGYELKNGDEIVWVYTCDLGKDVGDNSMWK